MKKNLLSIFMLFSVTLNLVFVGSYLYHKFIHPAAYEGPACNGQLIYRELNLSSEQISRFAPERDRFHAFVDHQSRLIREAEIELIDFLSADSPDREAIEKKQKQIQSLQQALQKRVIEHLLREAEILTPRQRARFFGLIKERIIHSPAGRPGWMPAGQQWRKGR